jgi:RimJ/RimL family protein N-acetyltransferase
MTSLDVNEKHQMFRQANDPGTATEILVQLSKSKDELIRGAIACNQSTPAFVIETLLNDSSEHVLSCLRIKGIVNKVIFIKPKEIVGNNLVFRNANKEDAAFILELRTDPVKGKYISKTSTDINLQIAWLEEYEKDDTQIYFIIENKNGERLGTVRLYDIKGDSFCWGSWILKEGKPSGLAIESALMVYHYALSLGFKKSHFAVRKGNKSVWKFHENFGAQRVDEAAEDYTYNISIDAIQKSLDKHKKYLPNGIEVSIFTVSDVARLYSIDTFPA